MPFKEREDKTIMKNEGMTKAPVIEAPIQKISTIVTKASTNRQLVENLQAAGFGDIQIKYKDKTGKEISQPPPNGFMDLTGLDKLKNVTITATMNDVNGKMQDYTIKIDKNVTLIDDNKTMLFINKNKEKDSTLIVNNVSNDSALKAVAKLKTDQETKDSLGTMYNSGDKMGFFNLLKDRGLTDQFLDLLTKELQRMSGGSAGAQATTEDRVTSTLQQMAQNDYQNKTQALVNDREEDAVKKGSKGRGD